MSTCCKYEWAVIFANKNQYILIKLSGIFAFLSESIRYNLIIYICYICKVIFSMKSEVINIQIIFEPIFPYFPLGINQTFIIKMGR